ncbi:MxaL protein [Ideonella sp.]|uniref:MxaL protein n=1 Tax=Ideonella sp. TaxID=1929293 RepID=UPI002B478F7B|nr:MxaL protein [Ideonella sp.]HJV72077.1 MxaL protein [Ideonella sp.]
MNPVWLDRGLLGGAALALAIGFMRPTWPTERALFEQVIVLDVTQSMNVTDTVLNGKPASRLAFAKHALRESLLRLPCGSRIGWAVFTEHRSFLLYSPIEVCAHLNELRSTLDRIDGRMAWIGGSEVAKGIHSGIGLVKQLPRPTALVFVTDGHEAPPLNPRHRPAFDGRPGEVAGLIVGVGDLLPSPIPKTDPDGRALGFWRADEVMQTDPRSQGRGASVGGETMVEDSAAAAPLPDASTGSEHLSSLHDAYLRLLASELGLGYHRLQSSEALSAALTAPVLARPVPVQADGRAALGVLALVLLLVRHLGHMPLPRRLRYLASRTMPKALSTYFS